MIMSTYLTKFKSINSFYSTLNRCTLADVTPQVTAARVQADVLVPKVRVRNPKWPKKACPARVAEAGQEKIETVHEPKPIQAADTLWGQGRRAMEDFHDPQTQVLKGFMPSR